MHASVQHGSCNKQCSCGKGCEVGKVVSVICIFIKDGDLYLSAL